MAAGGGADLLTAGAAVVFLGVVASLVFERYRIPDVVLLLLAGILIGPVLGLANAESFAGVAPAFTTLALAVILFEGGLDLNVRHLRARMGLTTLLLITSYFVTAAALAAVCVLLANFTWGLGFLFGFAMAPLSSSVLIALLGRLNVLPATRAILTVESALGDVLAVVAVLALAEALTAGGLPLGMVARSLTTSFVVGGALALVAGVTWLYVLRFLHNRPYTYLVTFAAALILFGMVEGAGGNGVIAVLVFALVLGNASLIVRHLPGATIYELDDRIRWFHAEMSFFVRTFFFIYLGFLVSLDAFTPRLLLTVLAVTLSILAVRALVVRILVQGRPEEKRDAGYLTFLIPRGLASAALAGLPAVVALSQDTQFSDLAFSTLLLTNLVMTTYILRKEHGFGKGAQPELTLPDFTKIDLEGLQEIAPEENEPGNPTR